MEKKESKPIPAAGPYPWFLCEKKLLKNKVVIPCGCHGWFLIVEDLRRCCLWKWNASILKCCLWNTFTLESMQLPSLYSKKFISYCRSSSPSSPGGPDSLIVIFFHHAYSFMFCRAGDQHWSEQIITHSPHYYEIFHSSPVFCNGILYAVADSTKGTRDLVVMDLNPAEDHSRSLGILPLHERPPTDKEGDHFNCCLVESCGEIFIIFLRQRLLEETEFEIFKSPLMGRIRVESFKDRVIFVDRNAAYSYQAANPETEGNCIHFTRSDRSILTFHMEKKTVSVSLHYSDLKSAIWLMEPTYSRIDPENVTDMQVDGEEANETGYLCQLPLAMLSSIASRLVFGDYINFRLLNRTCRSVAPPTRIKELARNSLPPLLMVFKSGEDKCKFIDPLHQVSYLMNNPYKPFDVRMCCSKGGWCLVAHNNYNYICLWNPFTKQIIPLQDVPCPSDAIIGCEILLPESPDCFISMIRDFSNEKYFDYIHVKEGIWETRFVFEGYLFELSRQNNPVFCYGHLCLLDLTGNVIIFAPDNISLMIVERPCESYYEFFLLESNNKLLAVFLGSMGTWLRVFKMDLNGGYALDELTWTEVDNVGDKTLYVSRISSFATTARTEEMKNTICLPRFYENKLMYYSLSSRRYHCYGSNVVLEDFYNTDEQLLSSWMEPSW